MPHVRIEFDQVVQDLVRAVPHNQDAVRLVRGLASAARTNWVRLAQQKLNTTARDYVQGISQPEEESPGVMVITLKGRVPNMVEQGWPSTDLRETVIPNARTRKVSKEGHAFVHVPFRHGTPGSSGKNTGRPMPAEIHRVAKHLAPHRSEHGMGSFKGPESQHRASVLRPGMSHVVLKKVSAEAQKILGTKARPWHSSSIYSGMVRQEKTYSKATQSQYRTWRTITTNPDAQTDDRKWMHPGIQARHLIREVQAGLAESLSRILPSLTRRTR